MIYIQRLQALLSLIPYLHPAHPCQEAPYTARIPQTAALEADRTRLGEPYDRSNEGQTLQIMMLLRETFKLSFPAERLGLGTIVLCHQRLASPYHRRLAVLARVGLSSFLFVPQIAGRLPRTPF